MRKRDLLLSFCALLLCVPLLSAQTTDHPLNVGGNVEKPVLIKQVNPKYPSEGFFRKHKDGIVWVKLIVDANGMPQNIVIEKSAGEKFDKSALDAVRKYRFRPATRDGKPVAVKLYVQVVFNTCRGPIAACKAAMKNKVKDQIANFKSTLATGTTQAAPAEGSGAPKH